MSRFFPVFIVLLCILVLPGPAAAVMRVSTGDVNGGTGSTVDIPVSVENAKDLGSMDIVISYDPAVLSVISVEKGSLNKGMISADTDMAGIVSIGIVDSAGINGNGAVAVLKMKVTGGDGTSSPLHIDQLLANDVKTHIDILTETSNGVFSVKSAGPAMPVSLYLAIAALAVAAVMTMRKTAHR